MACKPICACILVTIIAGAIVGGILFAVKSMNKEGDDPSESPKHNYVAALKIAMQFFDIQKCNFFFVINNNYFHSFIGYIYIYICNT